MPYKPVVFFLELIRPICSAEVPTTNKPKNDGYEKWCGAGFRSSHQHEEIMSFEFLFKGTPFWNCRFLWIERSLLVLGVPTLRPPDLPRFLVFFYGGILGG